MIGDRVKIDIKDKMVWILVKKEILPDGFRETWHGVGFGVFILILFYLSIPIILYLNWVL